MYVGCRVTLDYVDWMWHRLSTDCWSDSYAQQTLRCQLYFD